MEKFVKSLQVNVFLAGFSRLKPLCANVVQPRTEKIPSNRLANPHKGERLSTNRTYMNNFYYNSDSKKAEQEIFEEKCRLTCEFL